MIMPDEITSDETTHKLVFTDIEMEFLYTLLDNVSIKGVGAVVILNGIVEKVAETYTSPQPLESIED